MRLQVIKSKNAASFYAIKTVYKDGKQKTIIVEKIGTYAKLLEKLNGEDPYEWAKMKLSIMVVIFYSQYLFKQVFSLCSHW